MRNVSLTIFTWVLRDDMSMSKDTKPTGTSNAGITVPISFQEFLQAKDLSNKYDALHRACHTTEYNHLSMSGTAQSISSQGALRIPPAETNKPSIFLSVSALKHFDLAYPVDFWTRRNV